MKTLLTVRDLKKTYYIPQGFKKSLELQALRGLSFDVIEGETLAIVGESGCGKSTLAKVLLKLESITAGEIKIGEKPLTQISAVELSHHLQMVFQDPSSSLNRRKKVFDLIAEPLVVQGRLAASELRAKVYETAKACGVAEEMMARYPHMMSGGQRQRVGIARAMVTEPQILILDEPVSALDVSVQAQILNLLLDLREARKISFLFISHDLSVVRFLAQRVAVLYLGKIVELGTRDDIFNKPLHPYTRLLLGSAPQIGTEAVIETKATGELPSPLSPPPGCAFSTRCPYAQPICRENMPELRKVANHLVACHFAENWV